MRKKEVFAFAFIITLVVSSSVFAISSDIKEVYAPKETMIIQISGSILNPIMPDQIEFKRGNVNMPLEYDIKKVGENYYLWAIAPENANNYTLYVKNIASMISGISSITNYSKEFIVLGNLTDYYLKPGFVKTNQNFQIKIVSNLDNPFTIGTNFPQNGNILLNPGENVINFDMPDFVGSQFLKINLGKYSLPAYLIRNGSSSNVTFANISQPIFVFSPGKIQSVVMLGGDYPAYGVNLINQGESNITNVYLDYNRTLFTINPDQKVDLGINESFYYNLSIRGRALNKSLNEVIYARYDNFSAPLYLEINFTVNSSSAYVSYSNVSDAINYSSRKCIEVGNSICNSGETCNGTIIQTMDGSCCVGLCASNPSNGGGDSSWIGWMLGLIVIAIIAFVGYKYYSSKNGSNNIFQKKVSEADKKM